MAANILVHKSTLWLDELTCLPIPVMKVFRKIVCSIWSCLIMLGCAHDNNDDENDDVDDNDIEKGASLWKVKCNVWGQHMYIDDDIELMRYRTCYICMMSEAQISIMNMVKTMTTTTMRTALKLMATLTSEGSCCSRSPLSWLMYPCQQWWWYWRRWWRLRGDGCDGAAYDDEARWLRRQAWR